MNRRIIQIVFVTLFSIGIQNTTYAQENPDDIAIVDDAIENDFYEALKQRAIENYDKAIVSIEKCLQKDDKNPVFYHELGKNNLSLKRYIEAENAFQKAVNLDKKNRWFLNGLYDVYYETKNYEKSIPVVQQLISFDANMREDLVSLYMFTNQPDKAFEVIKDIEKTGVLTTSMQFYKLQIQQTKGKNTSQDIDLEQAIKDNPKVEQLYIDLILQHAQNNQEEKAFEVAKKLAAEIPSSDWAQISLFKFYLQDNQGEQASESLFKVLRNSKIDGKIKHRMFNEFLIFVHKSNAFYDQLKTAVDYLSDDKSVNVPKEVGKFFFNKKNTQQTQFYLEKALAINSNDFEVITILLDNYVQANDFDSLATKANGFIDFYPTQANLYYYAGFGYQKTEKAKEAIAILETGLDFVIENPELEYQFSILLSQAYENTGNQAKKEFYQKKAAMLKKK
jgi:tetratricopeptide (TPR) repeat protein